MTTPAPTIENTPNSTVPSVATRSQIATRIHQLLLTELGEDVDISLLLGPPDYARAVVSLCRSCGSDELARLAEQFQRLSAEDTQRQRSQQVTRYGASAAAVKADTRLG